MSDYEPYEELLYREELEKERFKSYKKELKAKKSEMGISDAKIKRRCILYRVPTIVFLTLSDFYPKYYLEKDIKKLKYHIVLLDRFDMLNELENHCKGYKKREILDALSVFKIPTKTLYSYLECINFVKRAYGVDRLVDVVIKHGNCLNKRKEDEVFLLLPNEFKNFVSSLTNFLSDNFDYMGSDDYINFLRFYFLSGFNNEDMIKKFPFNETIMQVRVKEYNKEWDEKEFQRKNN